jgi:hypothetical protein
VSRHLRRPGPGRIFLPFPLEGTYHGGGEVPHGRKNAFRMAVEMGFFRMGRWAPRRPMVSEGKTPFAQTACRWFSPSAT